MKVRLDASKGFRFRSLSAGKYFIAVYRAEDSIGFSAINLRFTLKQGEHKTLDVGSDMGSFTLTGTAKPFTLIQLAPRLDWEYTGLATYSDLDGRYRFDGLRPGVYRVNISRSSATRAYQLRVTLPEIEIDKNTIHDINR